MTVAEGVFYLFAVVAIVMALGVVTIPNVVHAALFLIGSLLSVAVFYILLSNEFLALVQILVYGGAVATIMLFGLMLTRGRDMPTVTMGGQWPLALVTVTAIALTLIVGIAETTWPRDIGEVTIVGVTALGQMLFEPWLLPFELASIVLLVALIGAVILSRSDEAEA